MGSARQNKNRQERIEAMRKAERARMRRDRALTIGGVAVIVLALGAGGVLVYRAADSGKSDDSDGGKPVVMKQVTSTVDDKGVRSWPAKELTRTHVEKKVKYAMNPPVGGHHSQAWLNCEGDVYDEEVPKENAVHALEHGSVWVSYTEKASPADLKKLKAKVDGTPYTFMSPLNDQKDPIMLSAWGKQRTVKSADDPAVEAFFKAYLQGPQTPEPGAACSNGVKG